MRSSARNGERCWRESEAAPFERSRGTRLLFSSIDSLRARLNRTPSKRVPELQLPDAHPAQPFGQIDSDVTGLMQDLQAVAVGNKENVIRFELNILGFQVHDLAQIDGDLVSLAGGEISPENDGFIRLRDARRS